MVAAAAVTATGALACAVCCVLPFALPAVALASAGGIIAWFAQAQSWMMDLALVAAAAAWLWVGWQSLRSKTRPAKPTLFAMSCATIFLVLAISWPFLEPSVVRLLAS
ncbi:hypothetical protein IVB05_12885 [Bradyrhizobium sp. 170]|nr:hypothetical protein IVB05_12885 [Bradyrhizobium sp. 170]